jgi:prevent-host-death family protein
LVLNKLVYKLVGLVYILSMKTSTIGAFDAKTHLSRLLDQVEAGEQIQITRRGRPVAWLVPCEPDARPEVLQRLVDRVREERGTYGVSARDIAEWKTEGRR